MFNSAHSVSLPTLVICQFLISAAWFWKNINCIILVFLIFSGIFELNFMSNQPASGYYQFTVAVTGDTRLVANHVEVRWRSEMETQHLTTVERNRLFLCIVPFF